MSVPSTSQQQLGSVEIGVSTGFTISDPAGVGTALKPTLLLYQNLNIQPGSAATVSLAVTAPCGTNTLTWSFQAQQANQWQSGNNANYLTLEKVTYTDGTTAGTTGTALKTAVTTSYSNVNSSACVLKFAGSPSVADAEVFGATTPTPAYEYLSQTSPGSGTPVQVGVFDSNTGALVNAAGTSVTIGLTGGGLNPGQLTNGSTTATIGSNGYATFGNLGITAAGVAYRLTANSTGLAQATSNAFTVVPQLTPCDPKKSACTATYNGGTGGSGNQVTAQTPGAGSYFGGGVNPSGLTVSCNFSPFNYSDLYDPTITWNFFQGATSGSKTVVLTIPKSVVQVTPNNGTSFYQICYAAPATFNTGYATGYGADGNPAPGGTYAVPIPAGGTPPYSVTDPRSAGNNATDYFGTTWYVGLLPDCSTVGNVAPCLNSKAGTNGNRVLTFFSPANDPSYR